MDQYYLLGSPVAHSLSPAMMHAAFSALGIDAAYGLIDTNMLPLKEAVARLRSEAKGWNVTMPDKNSMALLCDELSTASMIGGSVNTVLSRDGRLIGHTTDGTGLIDALARSGVSIRGGVMTLLGTGGAASAILIQCALDGASEIHVFANRPASKARVLAIKEKLHTIDGVLKRMVFHISNFVKGTKDRICIISHTFNEEAAKKLKERLESLHEFKKIIIRKNQGLVSYYGSDKALLVSYN